MSTSPSPVSVTPLDARALLARELGSIFLVILRVRFGGALALTTIGVLFAVYEPTAWKVAAPLAAAVVIAAVSVHNIARPPATPPPPRWIAWHMVLVIVAQSVAIVVTGGIHSPVILLLPVMNMAMALWTGDFKTAITAMLVPIAIVWALFATEAAGWGPSLVPGLLKGTRPTQGSLAWPVFMATAATLVIGAGMAISVAVRRALDGAIGIAAQARAEAVQSMRDRNRELLALSGELAHELKNPLASIRGLAALLEKKAPPDTPESQHLRVLRGEVDRMAGILDEFLNFSRPTTDVVLTEQTPDAIVGDAVLLHSELAAERGVTLRQTVHTQRRLLCDPRKVKQVLANLLQNALDASPPGSTVEVVVSDGRDDGVAIAVLDRGSGLAAEVRGRVFDPGVTSKDRGSGLGLVIARAIAEQHGGALTLEERDGGGCRADVYLPARPPAPPRPAATSEEETL